MGHTLKVEYNLVLGKFCKKKSFDLNIFLSHMEYERKIVKRNYALGKKMTIFECNFTMRTLPYMVPPRCNTQGALTRFGHSFTMTRRC